VVSLITGASVDTGRSGVGNVGDVGNVGSDAAPSTFVLGSSALALGVSAAVGLRSGTSAVLG
jgi:hypothetical protein